MKEKKNRGREIRADFKSVLLRFSVFGLRMGYGMDDTSEVLETKVG
jgi:hypothetical protein